MASSLITRALPPVRNTMAGSQALALKIFRGSAILRTATTASQAPRFCIPPIRVITTQIRKAGAPRRVPTYLPARHLSTTKTLPLFASVQDESSSAASQWTAPTEQCLDERPVLVIGAGNMGRRIALVWASASRPVTLYDVSQSAIDSAIGYITDNLGEYCAWRGTLPGHVCGTTDLRVATTTGRLEGIPTDTEAADIELHSGAKGPWMAIDCLPDSPDLEVNVLCQLEDLLPGNCILASNSSSLSTVEMAPRLHDPERLLNTHYFIPPRNLMVELMSSTRTHPAIFSFLARQMRRVGLTPMVVPAGIQSPGFIFNRVWAACKRETLAVVSEGVATPRDVDALFRDFFHAEKGPCERMDEVGLDVVASVETHALRRRPKMGRQHVLHWLEKHYLEEGRLGEKTGDGLYTRREREELKALHRRLRFQEVEETMGA